MNKWLLTENDLEGYFIKNEKLYGRDDSDNIVFDGGNLATYENRIVVEQARHIYNRLMESCRNDKHSIEGVPTLDAPDGMHYPLHRYLCSRCMAEFKEEIE